MQPLRFHKAILCVLALSTAAMFTGCGPQGYATPDDAYNAYQVAVMAGDYGKLADCFTPDGQQQTAGGLVMSVAVFKSLSKLAGLQGPAAAKKAEEKIGPLAAVLNRHGISDEKMLELSKGVGFGGFGNTKAANEKAGELVTDKRAFISDMFTAFSKISEAEGKSPAEAFKGELQDVQIDGDTASGSIFNAKGKNKKQPITFKKVDGKGWLIHFNQ